MSNSIFHLNLLKNYQLVTIPGVYTATVSYTITDKNLILDDYPRYLVPLKIITANKLEQLLRVMINETKKVSFSSVSKYFITGALWFEDITEELLPIKGEKVLATFDNKDGVLLCTHIELLPKEELDYIDINKLDLFRKTLTKLLGR